VLLASAPSADISFRDMAPAAYDVALLTYLDVLGFSDLIDESVRDPNTVEKIARTLRTFEKQFTGGGRVTIDNNNRPKNISHYWNFSDLMVRLTVYEEPEDLVQYLNWELLNLAHRQMAAVSEEILIRGAVTLDAIYHQHQLIFGPALVKGYLMERDLAIYPRIVIDEKLTKEIHRHYSKTSSRLWTEYLTTGEDGIEFVDYLTATFLDKYSGRVHSPTSARDILMTHKDVVLKKFTELDNSDQKRKAKAYWMLNYHNRCIDKISALRVPSEDTQVFLNEARIVSVSAQIDGEKEGTLR
jgi:hypothetical protein